MALESQSVLSVKVLSVQVWCSVAYGRFPTFRLLRRAHQTILDVVTAIQRNVV